MTPADMECPSEEVLASLHDRLLEDEELGRLSAHVSNCPRCGDLLRQFRAMDALVREDYEQHQLSRAFPMRLLERPASLRRSALQVAGLAAAVVLAAIILATRLPLGRDAAPLDPRVAVAPLLEETRNVAPETSAPPVADAVEPPFVDYDEVFAALVQGDVIDPVAAALRAQYERDPEGATNALGRAYLGARFSEKKTFIDAYASTKAPVVGAVLAKAVRFEKQPTLRVAAAEALADNPGLARRAALGLTELSRERPLDMHELRMLGVLQSDVAVPVLAGYVTGGPLPVHALRALARIPGDKADAALEALLSHASFRFQVARCMTMRAGSDHPQENGDKL